MNLAALIAEFRRVTTDDTPTYLWSDDDVVAYLNDAINEACERALLIEDRTTPACCQVTLADGTDTYALDPSVIRVKSVRFRGCLLTESSEEEMDRRDHRWGTRTGSPRAYILTERAIRIVPTPNEHVDAQDLALTVYRRPLTPLVLTDTAGVPEVGVAHHQNLMDWAFARAYRKRDAETINVARAAEHEALFTGSFGEKIDANVKRKQRDRRPPVTRFRFP